MKLTQLAYAAMGQHNNITTQQTNNWAGTFAVQNEQLLLDEILGKDGVLSCFHAWHRARNCWDFSAFDIEGNGAMLQYWSRVCFSLLRCALRIQTSP